MSINPRKQRIIAFTTVYLALCSCATVGVPASDGAGVSSSINTLPSTGFLRDFARSCAPSNSEGDDGFRVLTMVRTLDEWLLASEKAVYSCDGDSSFSLLGALKVDQVLGEIGGLYSVVPDYRCVESVQELEVVMTSKIAELRDYLRAACIPSSNYAATE